jgi:hypothetical protein
MLPKWFTSKKNVPKLGEQKIIVTINQKTQLPETHIYEWQLIYNIKCRNTKCNQFNRNTKECEGNLKFFDSEYLCTKNICGVIASLGWIEIHPSY